MNKVLSSDVAVTMPNKVVDLGTVEDVTRMA